MAISANAGKPPPYAIGILHYLLTLKDKRKLTLLSLLGVFLYAMTTGLCFLAAFTAYRSRHRSSHVVNWLVVSGFFLALIALRGLLIEDWFEQALRQMIRDSGDYNERRQFQAAIAIIILAVMMFGSFFAYREFARLRGWRDFLLFAVNMACAAMVALIGLRVLSLHAIDVFLYRFKINWAVDIGVTLFVGAAAIIYVCLARTRNDQSERATGTSSSSRSTGAAMRGRPR